MNTPLGSKHFRVHVSGESAASILRTSQDRNLPRVPGIGGSTWEPELRTLIAQRAAPGAPFEDKPCLPAGTSKAGTRAICMWDGRAGP